MGSAASHDRVIVNQNSAPKRTQTLPSSSNSIMSSSKPSENQRERIKTSKTDEEMMTDEEVENFRKERLDYLREKAMDVVAHNSRLEQYEQFAREIYNAAIIFIKSYFALKKTVRANLVSYRRDIAQLMIDTKYFNVSCDVVIYAYKHGWHLEDGAGYKHHILLLYLAVVQNFSDAGEDFAFALANEPGFVEIVKQILVEFLEKYYLKDETFDLAADSRGETFQEMMFSALGIAHNMSMAESNISKLRDADMIACLKPFLKHPDNKHALLALASLAAIINENECDIINSNKQIVKHLLDVLREGLRNNLRCSQEGWSCKECVFMIKVIARNDANVKTLVELGALELLVELGRSGDEDEQYESVSALWALCFDEGNQSLITEKPELGVVDLLVDLKSSENGDIKKACNGALWTLRDALTKTTVNKYRKIGEQFGADRERKEKARGETENIVTSENQASTKGHVMISYQWADQKVLKNVRDNIKARGFKVWMDIDQMGGSTLQAMADAVEGADIFLLCMSNKYKHSPTCRAEAEYAFQLRKCIIPLKMERGYTPDGWLGFIVGAKLFFEFSGKYPFEDKMKGLIKEIDVVFGETEEVPNGGIIIKPEIASVTMATSVHSVDRVDTASVPDNTSTVARIPFSKTTFDTVSKWTADDIKSWAERNGLQKSRVSNLTGGEVALLASMRLECPEFFYKCLYDILEIKDLLTLSKIVLALHNLS